VRFRFRLWAIVSRIVVSGALVVTCLLSSCEYGSDTGSGALAWSPDGSKMAFSSSDVSPPDYSHIWVMDTDGSNLVNLTSNVRASSVDPAWSPDGQRIAFTRYQGAYAIYLGHEYRRQQSNKAYVIK
jgi:Tol biopolymer transport system component